MNYHEQRDSFGNVCTHHSPIEAVRAGANPFDNAGVIDNKVRGNAALDKLAREGLLPISPEGEFARALGIICVGFLIVVGVALTYPWWKQLRDPAAAWERYIVSQRVADRREHFSDFAPVQAWPKDVQKLVARNSDLTLAEIVAEIPVRKVMDKKKQEEIGAALWFRYAAHGSKANTAFAELRDKTMKTKNGMWKSADLSLLPYRFLTARCEKGIEIACLDAAKVIASVTFHTIYSRSVEQGVTDIAIKQLPSTGRIASAPAVIELRKKLEAYD